jgi:hypothetical protein
MHGYVVHMPGSVGKHHLLFAGQLLRLDMAGYELTCAFPGLALANLRELRQLYLGDNRLSVRSNCCCAAALALQLQGLALLGWSCNLRSDSLECLTFSKASGDYRVR